MFALGAILCEILTGQPPYAGERRPCAEGRSRPTSPTPWRASPRAAPTAQIVTLAERCLAPSQADRPRDAGVVATAVGAHLAEAEERVRRSETATAEARARSAEESARAERERAKADRERAAAAQARTEAERAHERAEQAHRARRLTIGLAASVMVCFGLAASAVAWWTIDRAQRDEAVGREVEAAIAQASYLRGRAAERADVAAGKEALAAAQRAIDVAAARGAEEPLRRKAADVLVEAQADAARAKEAEAKIRRAGAPEQEGPVEEAWRFAKRSPWRRAPRGRTCRWAPIS